MCCQNHSRVNARVTVAGVLGEKKARNLKKYSYSSAVQVELGWLRAQLQKKEIKENLIFPPI